MLIQTSRFGPVNVGTEDVLLFAGGLIGYPMLRHWVLLADQQHADLAWLQCANQPQVALALVSPRRFQPDYQLRVTRGQLAELELSPEDSIHVLSVLSENQGKLTLNLRAPIVINFQRHLGRQVVACDEQPLQLPVSELLPATYRKSA